MPGHRAIQADRAIRKGDRTKLHRLNNSLYASQRALNTSAKERHAHTKICQTLNLMPNQLFDSGTPRRRETVKDV